MCEIGANTTIDRGAIGDTVLEEGVKLDNQIQIGHNCHIGAHTAMAACVGLSGSVTVGKRCMIGGMAGIVGHLSICDDVAITGLTMVSHSITRARRILRRHSGRGRAHVAAHRGAPEADRLAWRGALAALERATGARPRQRRTRTMTEDRTRTDILRLDINAILKQLPHRYPFLLVDRVLECVQGQAASARSRTSPTTSRSFPGISRIGP